MPKIILANKEELEIIQVNGASKFYQNANRDTLEFVFEDSNSMDYLSAVFNKENTRQITIKNDEGEYVYNDYVVQISVTKENVVLALETSSAPEQVASRIKVTMGQQTYTEKLIEQLLGGK